MANYQVWHENSLSRNICKESEAFEISELIFYPANREVKKKEAFFECNML
jgi:hypothetical protein